MTNTHSKHDHDRSEVWERPEIARLVVEAMGSLAANLRVLRKRSGLSQEKLAEVSGLHPKHVQRLEKGAANTTVATLAALAHGLGVRVDKLLMTTKRQGSRSS